MNVLDNRALKEAIESEEHAELIDGEIVIENRTSVQHNSVIRLIANAIGNYISSQELSCKVFTENVALYVNELCEDDKNFFLPDVMVVCGDEGIKDDGVHSSPLFVAEVTSESTKTNDYGIKLEIYKRIGVKEYWVVDLQRNVVFKYLSSEGYIPQTYMSPESMKVSVYPNLMIDLSSVL